MAGTILKRCKEPNCGHQVPMAESQCPHCGRPRMFANVDLAETDREKQGLELRYRKTLRASNKRGVALVVQAFEKFVAEQTHVVICRSLADVRCLSQSEYELFRTYAARGETSLAQGLHVLRDSDKWKSIRIPAEAALYGDENRRDLHFATMCPDDEGLSHYGECSITLRTELIAHRTTAFEENMLIFFGRHGGQYFRAGTIPAGHMAVWEERARLAVAKLGAQLEASHDVADFHKLLLQRGATSADDAFIELHVMGRMSVRTIAKVVLTRLPDEAAFGSKPSRALRRAIEVDLKKANVEWIDRTTTR